MSSIGRRQFLAASSAALAAGMFAADKSFAAQNYPHAESGKFKISLAAWSLHRSFNTNWYNLDLPRIAREDFGIDGVEYVNSFFGLPRSEYLKELNKRADHYGIRNVLIMIDGEGDMSDPDTKARIQTTINHRKWIDIAHFLGCHAVRLNMGYNEAGTPAERVDRAADSINRLLEYSEDSGLNIMVENHGGISSVPEHLIALIKKVNNPRFGALPDWGNFYEVDNYEGVKALMPYALAVSAKCYDFKPDGSHPGYDLAKMTQVVLDSGYDGFIGIEFEGQKMNEWDGVRAARDILKKMM